MWGTYHCGVHLSRRLVCVEGYGCLPRPSEGRAQDNGTEGGLNTSKHRGTSQLSWGIRAGFQEEAAPEGRVCISWGRKQA